MSTEKEIERANSYREMVNSWAWKDLINTLKEQKEREVSHLLMGSDNLLSARAFHKVLNYIENHVGFILGGVEKKI